MRTVFQQARRQAAAAAAAVRRRAAATSAGGRRPPAGGFPGGGFVGSGASSAGAGGAAAPQHAHYQFGGDYWVIALRDDQPVPVAVQDRSHGPRVQRDRLGPRARRSRAALAEREPLRAAGAPAGVHLAALRLDDAVPAASSRQQRRSNFAGRIVAAERRAARARVRAAGAHARGRSLGRARRACPSSRSHGWLDNAGSFELLAPLLAGLRDRRARSRGPRAQRLPLARFLVQHLAGRRRPARRCRRARLAALQRCSATRAAPRSRCCSRRRSPSASTSSCCSRAACR